MIRTAVLALSFLMNLHFKQVNDVPDKFNNTVTIQCSVSMYTEEFTQYTFIQDNQVCNKACVT